MGYIEKTLLSRMLEIRDRADKGMLAHGIKDRTSVHSELLNIHALAQACLTVLGGDSSDNEPPIPGHATSADDDAPELTSIPPWASDLADSIDCAAAEQDDAAPAITPQGVIDALEPSSFASSF